MSTPFIVIFLFAEFVFAEFSVTTSDSLSCLPHSSNIHAWYPGYSFDNIFGWKNKKSNEYNGQIIQGNPYKNDTI